VTDFIEDNWCSN